MSRNADRMKSSRKRALKTLVELDPETIDTLTRRARFKAEADTKPDSVGRSKGVVSDPTLSRVVAIMSGKNFTDPVFESVKRIAQLLSDIADLSVAIDNELIYLSDKTPDRTQRTANCGACEREVMCTSSDRLRSGYCQRCYDKWRKAGKPFRSSFEAQMKEETVNSQ